MTRTTQLRKKYQQSLNWLKEKIEDLLTPKKRPRRKTKPARKKKKVTRLRPRKKASKKKVVKKKSKARVKKATPKKRVVKKTKKKKVAKKAIKKVVKSRPSKKKTLKKKMAPKKKVTKKKVLKKKIAKKKATPKKTVSKGVKIGTVSHAFTKIQVIVFKVESPFKVGDVIVAWHKDTKIGRDKIKSMQINHIPIDEARKGEEIGLKLKLPVKVGDDLYLS